MRPASKVLARAAAVVIAGTLAAGASESASPSPSPSPEVQASPSYVYGPGSAGLGYYRSVAPGAAPAPANTPTILAFNNPGRQAAGGRSGVPRTRDWSTGRSHPGSLNAKPWLRPRG